MLNNVAPSNPFVAGARKEPNVAIPVDGAIVLTLSGYDQRNQCPVALHDRGHVLRLAPFEGAVVPSRNPDLPSTFPDARRRRR